MMGPANLRWITHTKCTGTSSSSIRLIQISSSFGSFGSPKVNFISSHCVQMAVIQHWIRSPSCHCYMSCMSCEKCWQLKFLCILWDKLITPCLEMMMMVMVWWWWWWWWWWWRRWWFWYIEFIHVYHVIMDIYIYIHCRHTLILTYIC